MSASVELISEQLEDSRARVNASVAQVSGWRAARGCGGECEMVSVNSMASRARWACMFRYRSHMFSGAAVMQVFELVRVSMSMKQRCFAVISEVTFYIVRRCILAEASYIMHYAA